MKIRWIGHAAFYIETAEGLRIRTDPYDGSIGLPASNLPADVVTVSHEHYDHNAVNLVPDSPKVIRGIGEWTVGSAVFRGVASFHDEVGGAQRGPNTIFVIAADGLTVVHLGDLGHSLTDKQRSAIGHVDVLLVPVGGKYTIDAAGAAAVVDAISPRIVVPMHFRIPNLTIEISDAEQFLADRKHVEGLDELDVTPETLPEATRTVVLLPRP